METIQDKLNKLIKSFDWNIMYHKKNAQFHEGKGEAYNEITQELKKILNEEKNEEKQNK